MTTLRIEHHTTYRYTRPLEFGRHRLVLRPREGHDLRVASMALEIFPAHRLTWLRDVFGNSIAIADFTQSAERLEIRSEVVSNARRRFRSRSRTRVGKRRSPWCMIRLRRSSCRRIKRRRIPTMWKRCDLGWMPDCRRRIRPMPKRRSLRWGNWSTSRFGICGAANEAYKRRPKRSPYAPAPVAIWPC